MIIVDETEHIGEDMRFIDNLRQNSDVPIIVLTQNHETESLRRVMPHCVDDFISKPFRKKVFVTRVRAKIRRTAITTARQIDLTPVKQSPSHTEGHRFEPCTDQ